MIKKRNLDSSLIQWIMSQTGLGPVIGNVYYVAPTASTTSQFRTSLADMGISDPVYSTLADAYAKTASYRNDVIIVAPGVYTTTAELAWTKSNVHLIGADAGSLHNDYTLTPGVPIFYTATTTQASVLNLTGQRNTFHNIIFENNGADAACLQAVTLNGIGNSFYHCGIHGIMNSTQMGTAACCSLNIAGGGHYSYFEDCEIGTREWGGARTSVTQGQLRFTATTGGGPGHGVFKNCEFNSYSDTAGVPMVYIAAQRGQSSLWRYIDCLFFNFSENYAQACTEVFKYGVAPVTVYNVLERCTAVGYTEWQTANWGSWVCGAIPSSGSGGGLAEILDAAVEA